jgi:hypothetical protein
MRVGKGLDVACTEAGSVEHQDGSTSDARAVGGTLIDTQVGQSVAEARAVGGTLIGTQVGHHVGRCTGAARIPILHHQHLTHPNPASLPRT